MLTESRHPCRLNDWREENTEGDVRTFVLERPEVFDFHPGQYVWIGIDDSRSLPMAIASGEPDHELHFTIRRSKGTAALFGRAVGEYLHISNPMGSFFPATLIPSDSPVLLVGGGTGVTPLRSALRSLAEQHPVRAVIGAKRPNELLFEAEFRQREGVTLTVDEGEDSNLATGPVTAHLNALDPESFAFVCGPNAMMKAVLEQLLNSGLKPHHVFLSVQAINKEGQVLGPVMAADDPRLVSALG